MRIIAGLLVLASGISGETLRLADIEGLRGASAAQVASIWQRASAQGTPLVERAPGTSECVVTFLWRGSVRTRNAFVAMLNQVQLANHAYSAQMKLERVAGTGVWFRSYRLRCDARFTYKLGENLPAGNFAALSGAERQGVVARLVIDPLNRTGQFETTMGPASIAELPDAERQILIRRADGVARGSVYELTFTSSILNNQRSLWIYTPPAYSPADETLPLLLSFDGETRHANSDFPIPAILDNLIAQKRIPRMLAVLVGNARGARQRELSCSEPFDRFLATELLPWLRDRYRLRADPGHNVVAGASLGGLAAACTAMRNPETFGNVLIQSGAFAMSEPQMRPEAGQPAAPRDGELFTSGFPEAEWITTRFARNQKLPLRFYVEAGLMEDVRWEAPLPFYAQPSTLLAARHFRDVIRAKGYDLIYHEYNGGHDAVCWRGTFGEALAALAANK